MHNAIGAPGQTLAARGRSDAPDSTYLTGLAMALGHSLGNPLTALSAQVKALTTSLGSDQFDPVQARQVLDRIGTILESTTRRVSAVTAHFDSRASVPATTDLHAIVGEIADRIRGQTICARLNVRLDLAADVPALSVNRDQIARALSELAMNAAEAMFVDPASDGTMTIRTRATPHEVHLEVCDTGAGVADPERIFDMHHTTKRGRAGTGLSIARSLVLANGGQLSAAANAPTGLRATMALPRPDLAPTL